MTEFVFDHVGLSVRDVDAQRHFYGRALDLVEEAGHIDAPEAHLRTVILRSPSGLQIELVERAGSVAQGFADSYDGAGVQGYFHWALAVDDLQPSFDRLLAAGATAISAPADAIRPGFRYAYLKDPEDNLIELIQPARSGRAA
jgi:catechol 2,3-dioxygenase-like lactoylglutathione lyase family enzyme